MTAHIGPRRDTLPEGARYLDEGCHLYKSCLSCPRSFCIYEYEAARDAEIAAAYKPCTPGSAEAVARRFGVSERTVHRAAARYRNASAESRDERGKPVSEIGNGGFRQRQPWPQLRRAM